MKKIYVLGGGTFSHVRNHLSLATPAFGETARAIHKKLCSMLDPGEYDVNLVLTKMADSSSKLVTNSDVSALVDELVADPDTKGIVFNVALTDYEGQIGDVSPSKYATRMETSKGQALMVLTPAEKIISKIRKTRKDIFAVGFKTTCGADEGMQYSKALRLMKLNSLNLVLANDTGTRQNVIVAPEESRYCSTTDREEVLDYLVQMMASRMKNTFTRSTVIPGDAVPWHSKEVPQALRAVVDHCIKRGAYKPFLGKTVGHFAVKIDDTVVLTSMRKSNFNELATTGLVKIESDGDHSVIAHGFKPSVGGQSQRIIFKEHPELDCIVHFHCPLKENQTHKFATKPQWPNECGSHECGKNTSDGLTRVDLGEGHYLEVVYLADHGPNIVFHQSTPSSKVIDFIESNFSLDKKTGGIPEDAIFKV